MSSLHHHHGNSLAELLDLDAALLESSLSDIMAWMAARAPDGGVRRILDVGAGTGNGTIALAHHFPQAEIVAVDVSGDMLRRIRARLAAEDLGTRVSTVEMDLERPWPELGSFDLIWSSSALHELTDPDSTLTTLHRSLTAGGLLTIVEMDGPPRFLEDETGNGLEARIHERVRATEGTRTDHPDWTRHLVGAGFTGVEKASFPADRMIDGMGIGGRYAQAYLRRIQQFIAPRLAPSDRDLLAALVADEGPMSLRHRDDLRLRATRSAWAAHRP